MIRLGSTHDPRHSTSTPDGRRSENRPSGISLNNEKGRKGNSCPQAGEILQMLTTMRGPERRVRQYETDEKDLNGEMKEG